MIHIVNLDVPSSIVENGLKPESAHGEAPASFLTGDLVQTQIRTPTFLTLLFLDGGTITMPFVSHTLIAHKRFQSICNYLTLAGPIPKASRRSCPKYLELHERIAFYRSRLAIILSLLCRFSFLATLGNLGFKLLHGGLCAFFRSRYKAPIDSYLEDHHILENP